MPRLTGACLLLLYGTLAVLAAQRSLHDIEYNRISTEVSFWGREDYLPSRRTRDDTAAAAQSLSSRHPGYPDYLELHAATSAWLARFNLDRGRARALAGQASDVQRDALRVRPAHLAATGRLAEYATLAGKGELVSASQRRRAELRSVAN